MYWLNRRKQGRLKTVEAISIKLRSQGKSSEDFEIMLSHLTLEEVIQLKLEVTTRMLANNKFYGFPLWALMPNITREALLGFALSNTFSRKDTASFLGITERNLKDIIKRFKPFSESYGDNVLSEPEHDNQD